MPDENQNEVPAVAPAENNSPEVPAQESVLAESNRLLKMNRPRRVEINPRGRRGNLRRTAVSN